MELNEAMTLIEWVVKQCEQGRNLDAIRIDYARNYHQPSSLSSLKLASLQHANPDKFILDMVKGQ